LEKNHKLKRKNQNKDIIFNFCKKKGTNREIKQIHKIHKKGKKRENNVYLFCKTQKKGKWKKKKQKNSFENLQKFIVFFVASLVAPNSLPCCIVILLETKIANPL
jgi:hypothetical protein